MAPAPSRCDALYMTITASTAAQALRGTKVLVTAYLALCVLTLIFAAVFHDNATIVTDAVWVRATIVTLSAVLTFLFARSAARGSKRGYLRLRIVSAVMVVAIAVIIALPGLFPTWMRVEQGVCGLLLLSVVVVINGRRVRSRFTG
jgi:cytochrome bd-type quinol oxidase subunit 2